METEFNYDELQHGNDVEWELHYALDHAADDLRVAMMTKHKITNREWIEWAMTCYRAYKQAAQTHHDPELKEHYAWCRDSFKKIAQHFLA